MSLWFLPRLKLGPTKLVPGLPIRTAAVPASAPAPASAAMTDDEALALVARFLAHERRSRRPASWSQVDAIAAQLAAPAPPGVGTSTPPGRPAGNDRLRALLGQTHLGRAILRDEDRACRGPGR